MKNHLFTLKYLYWWIKRTGAEFPGGRCLKMRYTRQDHNDTHKFILDVENIGEKEYVLNDRDFKNLRKDYLDQEEMVNYGLR